MTTLAIAVVTVSDTRTLETDLSGALLAARLVAAGHLLHARVVVRDERDAISATLRGLMADPQVRVVLCTGGSGLTDRDVTPDVVAELATKRIPGFGELFRALSFAEIGSSTIQSRADAGVCGDTLVFVLPGSPGACALAWDKILVQQLDVRHRPCNFVELLPKIGRPRA
jgi:molybdenum cofactor biosynthesis protein B